MSSVFHRFNRRLQGAIQRRLGWTSLRPVQEEAGEALLGGKNAVILAPTAGGKTEASIFPMLSEIMDSPAEGVRLLYIAPIKALLNNQADRLGTYTEMVGLRRFVWHGDTGPGARRRFLREPAELLMTTPESLEVMLLSSKVPLGRLFPNLRGVIIDEVHALAGSDRGAHLMSVLERLAPWSQEDIQRIGLSATVGNPQDILTWLKGTSQREGIVVDPPKGAQKREILIALTPSVAEVSRAVAKSARGVKSLVFCQSRSMTESIATELRRLGAQVWVHHSSVSLEERQDAEARFHKGREVCIVCTSTLELGIDIGDLDKVIQVEAPDTVSSFLQRMGRTGRRRGSVANATFFCQEQEGLLQAIALVELAREGWIEPVEMTQRSWPVLVHQILATAFAKGGASRGGITALTQRVPDLRGFKQGEVEGLIDHMIAKGFLFEDRHHIALGDEAERVFGRRNFMELYAVFSSPALFRVKTTNGRELGTLDQGFVDRLKEGEDCFLLGGRPWLVFHVDHKERVIRVQKAPYGKKPSWGGFLPRLMGQVLCERIRALLIDDAPIPYLHPRAAEDLDAARESQGPMLRRAGLNILMDDGQAHWWTFAGGRINYTLKHALEAQEGWTIVADNFHLKIKGDGLSHDVLKAAIERLRAPGYWRSEATLKAISMRLPDYRLSKFQPAMPPLAIREMLMDTLLDVRGVERWVSG